MTEVETALADTRAAVKDFAAAARALTPTAWQTPRHEGAWTPAQIVEHVAIVFEYNVKVLAGTAQGVPWLLRPLLQPLLRRMVVTNTMKAGKFTRKGRAPSFFHPSATPASAEDLVARMDRAVGAFEAGIRSRPRGDGTIYHPAFGTITMRDWVRLQAIHVRHHLSQFTST